MKVTVGQLERFLNGQDSQWFIGIASQFWARQVWSIRQAVAKSMGLECGDLGRIPDNTTLPDEVALRFKDMKEFLKLARQIDS